MIPTVSVPNIQMPAPIQPVAFAAGGASDLARFNQLPFQSVASAFAASPTYNHLRGQVPTRSEPAMIPSVLSAPIAPVWHAGSGAPVSYGFSTLFMAQVIGQGSANDNHLIQSFMSMSPPRSPTMTMDTLEAFAMTKYLPSQAAKPMPEPTGAAQLLPPVVRSQPISAPMEMAVNTANNNAGTSMASLDMMQLSRRSGGVTQAVPSGAERALPRESAMGTEPIRVKPSLIRPRGVSAYDATVSRNSEQLQPVTPVRETADAVKV